MSYSTKNIKRDAGGIAVPQYYNPASDDFEAASGEDGSIHCADPTKLRDYIRSNTSTDKTYSAAKSDIMIKNDGAAELSVTLDSTAVADLLPGEMVSLSVPAFTNLVITATDWYRCWVSGKS